MCISTAPRQSLVAISFIVLTHGVVLVQKSASSLATPLTGSTLKTYGLLEGHAIQDFDQSSPSDLFTNLAIQPLDNVGGFTGNTSYTGETSRLGLDVTTPLNSSPVVTKLELDFYGYTQDKRNKPRLRQAYAAYKGWLFDKNQGVVLGYARVFSVHLCSNFAAGFNRGKTAQAIDNRSITQLFANLIYSSVKSLEWGRSLFRASEKNLWTISGRCAVLI